MRQRENFYFDFSPFVAERLSDADVQTLEALEDQWLSDAELWMSDAEYGAAAAQWNQWLAEAPEYRLIAYYDGFGGVQEDIPAVLLQGVGWQRSDANADLAPIFAKVAAGLAAGYQSGISQTGGGSTQTASVGLNGIGVVLLAGAVLFLMSRNRR